MEEPTEATEATEVLEWYKLLDGSHNFRGMRVKKGGKILLTEKEAQRLGSRVVRVVQGKTTARDWSTTQDMKAAEVIALANETTSVSELESLYEVEEKGQNRPSVLKAIEKRVAALEGAT